MFNEKIAAIQLIRRKRRKEAEHRFYTEDWEPFEDAMSIKYPIDNVVAPPKYLDDMLIAAKKLGLAYNMYVRIDFYATDKGCVFGEFTPTPSRGNNYTEYASQYFEQCWEDVYPDPDQV
jgi:hypothetical protein